MADDQPTYRIDPIAPDEIGTRFRALLTRLEPILDPSELASVRDLLDHADHGAAFAWLDAITDDAAVTFETSVLVELVLLGQACRST